MLRCVQRLSRDLLDGGRDWLLLFDIDGTLLDTGGKGLLALRMAAEEIFSGECPPLDLAGATDLGVLQHLSSHYQKDADPDLMERFFERYHYHLGRCLGEEGNSGRVMDGVVEVLEILSCKAHVCMGLLTGNSMMGASIKLSHYSLDKYFHFGAYGSDRADRNQLARIALDRAYAYSGKMHLPEQTLVIGDTPKDIACAHSIGASCLAVATGNFSEQQLLDAGADWALESLLDLCRNFS